MSDDPKKPDSPFRLNRQRIVLLLLGALLLTYVISAMLGGLGNYQQLKESAAQPAAETTSTSP
ncbi:hypothetical protein [Devosia sp.]|uniref:hypothetical protein n=1 Tax=Devosia sp. TaxID=1871048 RepID=UPI003F705821